MSHSPDFVDRADRAMPDGGDSCPVGTLPSEPLCVVTDDMTYQQNIEALSGTMHDYDAVCDNLLDYFDYDDPNDCEELNGFDGPWRVECVTDRVSLMVGLSSTQLGLLRPEGNRFPGSCANQVEHSGVSRDRRLAGGGSFGHRMCS